MTRPAPRVVDHDVCRCRSRFLGWLGTGFTVALVAGVDRDAFGGLPQWRLMTTCASCSSSLFICEGDNRDAA